MIELFKNTWNNLTSTTPPDPPPASAADLRDDQKAQLQEPQAEASLLGARRPVFETVTGGLTPQRLANLMRDANDGDPEAYLELCEEMEEKDLHYVSVLGTRKRQVAQLPMAIEPVDGAGEDDPATNLAQELIDSGVIDRALFDMLDAVGKGISFSEIMWDTKTDTSKWLIPEIIWRNPRFFTFDRVTRTVPLLRQAGGAMVPLAPFKFIYLQMKAKSGLPLRGGIARAVAWAFLFKNYGLKDWVQFAESYGQPLRVGEYAPGATEDEQRSLLRAVAAMGSDFGAIIPTNMAIKFIEAGGKAASADLYEKMCRYLDEQISKAVLGQTGTTDSTPGKLGGSNDHTKVREDIERADAVALSAVLNMQLVRPYIDLNIGPPKDGKYPWLKIGRIEEQDIELMLQVIETVVPMGAKVGVRAILDAVGIPQPGADEDVLMPAAGGGAPPTIPLLPSPTTDIGMTHRQGRFAEARYRRSLAAAMAGVAQDGLAAGVELALQGWQADMDPIAAQIVKVMQAATDYPDLMRRLTQMWPGLSVDEINARLARFTFQATLGGLAGDGIRPGLDDPDQVVAS